MSNSKKIFLRVIPVFLVLLVVFTTNVFGFTNFETGTLNGLEGSDQLDTANDAVKGIWGTVLLVLQICAVAAFVLAGVRYMFAAPDAKADIKKQTVGLVVGAILVFGATFVIDFLVDITKDIAGVEDNKPKTNQTDKKPNR